MQWWRIQECDVAQSGADADADLKTLSIFYWEILKYIFHAFIIESTPKLSSFSENLSSQLLFQCNTHKISLLSYAPSVINSSVLVNEPMRHPCEIFSLS